MRFLSFLVPAAGAQAVFQGFNYGSTFTDGSSKQQSDFQAEFNRAKSLQDNGGFTSARLYTMIQGGTTNIPTSAIPAAINTSTTLLLGLWASAGQAAFSNEVGALTSAVEQYGTAFTSLIAGISVGSEDLYRVSPTGIENLSGAGASAADIVNYISQVRSAMSGTSAASPSIGHVDTWTAWVNGSNNAVITACDWLGMDAYPYFQKTIANGINTANSTFFDAYDATVGVSNGKPVWITETGWPVSGPSENLAVASIENAQTYFSEVGCAVLGKVNTWWYTLQEPGASTPYPSFGIAGSDFKSAPLYNVTCGNGKSAPAFEASSSTARKLSSQGFATMSTSTSTIAAQTSISASASTAALSASSRPTPPSPSRTSCPTNLNGEYQYPHLIVPVDSGNPTKAYGTSYNGTFTPSIHSLFNFDMPSSYAGRTCSLVFFSSARAALQSFPYSFNGRGGVTVSELSAPATEHTTYDTVPAAVAGVFGAVESLQPGNAYIMDSYTCNAGSRQTFEFSSTGGLELSYFQTGQPDAMGVFITVC